MSDDQQEPEPEAREAMWERINRLTAENEQLKQEIRDSHDMLDVVLANEEGHSRLVNGTTPTISLVARLFRYGIKKEKCPHQ